MEGSCPVVVRHVDEPEANRPHTQVCEGHLSQFSLDIFDMTEEDRLFDFLKGPQPTPKCPRLRGETGSQPARLKVLSQGESRPGQGQGPKVSKRQGLQEEAKPEAKKSELKIRSQSGPRRKKKGFICSKPLKKLRVTALKKKWKEFVSYSNWINGSSNWK